MPGAVLASGGPTASQKYATIKPREYRGDGTERWIIWLHYAGASAYSPWASGGEGSLKLLQAIGASIPVLTIDGGKIPAVGADNGLFNVGNSAVVDTITDAVAWVVDPTKGGGKTDKVILGASSQGTPGIINYAKANPTKVAAIWTVLPLSDLDDARNNNRPAGWSNATTQNAPTNCTSICTAHGLAANTTNDGVHGTSSDVPLPAGVNPATADLSALAGIPIKAWYSASDATVPASTVTDLFVTKLGGSVATITPDNGHADSTLGNVVVADVLAFLQSYL